MKEVLVFDVNETLLDLSALAPYFESAFGDAEVLSQWFGELLRSSLVATVTGEYADFGMLGADALDTVAQRLGRWLAEEDRAAILGGMRELPPHPEVPSALARLRDAGFRLATLTNSPPEILQAQMAHAGLTRYFEALYSVEETRRFKPAPEPYLMAARRLGIEPAGLRMIAAHDWDVAGALRAGCRAAFVARHGNVMGSLLPQPDIVGHDLAEVAERLVKR